MRIEIIGGCRVDGTPLGSVKPIELAVTLALAGGQMNRDSLRLRLYEQEIAESTLPTIAYRARRLGIDVGYEQDCQRFSLRSIPDIDVLHVYSLLEAHRITEALDLYHGPCLPTSSSPIAEALRHSLEARLTYEVVRTGDQELIRSASARIDECSLAEPAMRGDHLPAAVLGRAYLNSYNLILGT